MEKNKDFVLKLKIKAADGSTEIRRVRLPRISDQEGGVSYDELVGLVVTFTFPEDKVQNFHVSLTYLDVDEDTVAIGSSEELVDAIEQFAGKKVLRISTEVRRKTGLEAPKPTQAADVANSRQDRGTSTTEQSGQPQVQHVLESFAGVLATAVSGLQEGLSNPSAHNRPALKPNSADSNTVAPATMAAAAGLQNDPDANDSSAKNKKTVQDTAGVDSKQRATKAPAEAAATEKMPREVPRPFIHGRHTCDSCLTTPIVGKRYNATNLPDYDLCQNCFKNYKGKEIRFQTVELDRDRAFQERWHRRHERIHQFRNGRLGHRQRGRRNRGRWQPGNPPYYPCLPHVSMESSPPPSCSPPPAGTPQSSSALPTPSLFWPHLGPHVGPHLAPHVQNLAAGDDTALKEAIRRSLQDITPKETDMGSEVQPSAPVEPSSKGEEEEVVKQPVVPASTPVVKEDICENEMLLTEPVLSVRSVSDLEEEKEVTVDNRESMEDKKPALPQECTNLQRPGVERDFEDLMDSESVDSEKLAAEEDNDIKKLATVNRETIGTLEGIDSFASDAIGIGDVAEAVGTTLDIVAGVISEMLNEGDSEVEKVPETNSSSGNSKEEKPDGEKTAAVETESGDYSKEAGALILESDGNVESVEETLENEWHVVGAGDDATSRDEEIARAAEMLGSALFQSDIRNSEENVSTLTNSDSFSIPSTVPSISTSHSSHVAAAQRNIWGTHLKKLSELGFNNEDLCVEILERLKAANIGVGSDDDVSVTKVVNEILGEQ